MLQPQSQNNIGSTINSEMTTQVQPQSQNNTGSTTSQNQVQPTDDPM